MAKNGVIAVHVGAGSHSQSLHKDYKFLMKLACKKGAKLLKNGASAVDVACAATKILEDSHLTNAGYGSSLTMEGRVECDAGIMDGSSLNYGACGSVSRVRNPISLSKAILDEQNVELVGGLVQPSLLVGEGAEKWALDHGVQTCDPEYLKSEKAVRIYTESINYLKKVERNKATKRRHSNDAGCNSQDRSEKSSVYNSRQHAVNSENRQQKESNEINFSVEFDKLNNTRLDTVGAVVIDCHGNVASAVSSGGLLLKTPGRVGQAAVYGSGCWSENNYENSGIGIAVSTSGCGEHLVKTMFAQLCVKEILHTDLLDEKLSDSLKERFINSPFLKNVQKPMGGALVLRHNAKDGDIDIYWLHSTQSMGVAYADLSSKRVDALFSELPASKVGNTFAIGTKFFGLESDGSSTECVTDGEESP